jgi:hypothetical protein
VRKTQRSECSREFPRRGSATRTALPFDTLVLEWYERDAAKVQARRGERYQTSTSGQSVVLGGGVATKSKAELEREIKAATR